MVEGKVQNMVMSFVDSPKCIPTTTARLSFIFLKGKLKNLRKIDDTEV